MGVYVIWIEIYTSECLDTEMGKFEIENAI